MAKKKVTGKKPKKPKPLPRCKAFLICEKVIDDKISKSRSLIGLFTEFSVRGFPVQFSPFWLFIQLSDGIVGQYSIDIEIQDLKNNLVIFRRRGIPVEFACRPETVDAIIWVPPLRIISPGSVYAVVIFADDQPIADSVITVRVLGDDNAS